MAGAACTGEFRPVGFGVAAFTFCLGASVNGAPTEISHRCPGCPCAGLSLGEAVAAALLFPGKETVFAGVVGVVVDGVRTGKETGLVAIVPGPLAFFSSQELKAAKQKRNAV